MMKKFSELGCSKAPWRRICADSQNILSADGKCLTDDDGFSEYDDCTVVEQTPDLYERLRITTEALEKCWIFFDNKTEFGSIEKIIEENKKVLEKCNKTRDEIINEEDEEFARRHFVSK